jgi:hypothetical protein
MEKIVITEAKESNTKYWNTYNTYLSNSLSFLGFRFYKFQDETGQTYYSFLNSPQLHIALLDLFNTKNKIKNIMPQK